MRRFPFENGWGGARRMPFPPPVPPFPEPCFNGMPSFQHNHPPPPNFPAQCHPPLGPVMGFPRLSPMPYPPHMPFEGPPMVQESFPPQMPLHHGHPPVGACEPPHPPEERFARREWTVSAFLDSHRPSKKVNNKNVPSTVEFRMKLKKAFCLARTLSNCKEQLSSMLNCDENSWIIEMDKANQLKKELDTLCCELSSPENLGALQKRIRLRAKKRASKTQHRQERRVQIAQETEALHWKIDRWLDQVKEKNLKLKRDAALKKEADNILCEVRRKVHEARRVSEFLRVLEKLRTGRQEYASQIGLELSSDHAVKFADTISSIRSCFANQLEQYEGEERALKVMVEAEQEERQEEEGRRRLQTALNLLRQRQDSMLKVLFGPEDLPPPGSPLFLFYQHHNSANCNIDSLVQIRRQWDAFISEEGEAVPQQWVAPPPPSGTLWELALGNSTTGYS